MRQLYLAFALLVVIWRWRFVGSITLGTHVDEYLKQLTKEFLANPRNIRYDHPIIPPRIGETIEDFLLPKVFLWCPIQHYGLNILCPVHQLPLTVGYFTYELQKKCPRNPPAPGLRHRWQCIACTACLYMSKRGNKTQIFISEC